MPFSSVCIADYEQVKFCRLGCPMGSVVSKTTSQNRSTCSDCFFQVIPAISYLTCGIPIWLLLVAFST